MNGLHPIELIYFDSISEEKLGSFPIDRGYYAELIETVEETEPFLVILKFFFDSETDSDKASADKISQYGNVLTQATTYIKPGEEPSEDYINHISIQIDRKGLLKQEYLLLPNRTLFTAFSSIGLVDFQFEKKEYFNCPLAIEYKEKVIPSLALVVGSICSKSKPERENGQISLSGKLLSDKEGNLKLNLSEPRELYPTHSFVDVLEADSEFFDFTDKIVIIFIDNAEIRSVRTEYEETHNPAEIVADSINTVLQKLE